MDPRRKRSVRHAVLAGRALRKLDDWKRDRGMTTLWVANSSGESVELPASAALLLRDVLADLAEGREVTVAPAELALGTTEASRMLGVSRQWLVELVERDELPCEMVGTKRRIPLGALVARRRAKSMELHAAAQAIGEAEGEPEIAHRGSAPSAGAATPERSRGNPKKAGARGGTSAGSSTRRVQQAT